MYHGHLLSPIFCPLIYVKKVRLPPYRSITSRGVLARETQICITLLLARSSSLRMWSRWSGTPSRTAAWQMPHSPRWQSYNRIDPLLYQHLQDALVGRHDEGQAGALQHDLDFSVFGHPQSSIRLRRPDAPRAAAGNALSLKQ